MQMQLRQQSVARNTEPLCFPKGTQVLIEHTFKLCDESYFQNVVGNNTSCYNNNNFPQEQNKSSN